MLLFERLIFRIPEVRKTYQRLHKKSQLIFLGGSIFHPLADYKQMIADKIQAEEISASATRLRTRFGPQEFSWDPGVVLTSQKCAE